MDCGTSHSWNYTNNFPIMFQFWEVVGRIFGLVWSLLSQQCSGVGLDLTSENFITLLLHLSHEIIVPGTQDPVLCCSRLGTSQPTSYLSASTSHVAVCLSPRQPHQQPYPICCYHPHSYVCLALLPDYTALFIPWSSRILLFWWSVSSRISSCVSC